MKHDIIETIRETLYLKQEAISDATRIEEIVKDSMDLVELLAVLSDKYDVTIYSARLKDIHTIADIVDYVVQHRNTLADNDSMTHF